MALNLITGGAGSGKSYYIYDKIIKESEKQPHTDYLIIVPEQFTMQTQKDMVMLSKAKGIMNIDVLSFMRLAYRVLEKTPALKKPVLADEGKGMVIRRILKEHESEWKTFGSNINRQGFVEEIKSVITEFLQYRIDDEEISRYEEMAGDRKLLKSKLTDLGLVNKYYREYMKERYISAEEILELLAGYIAGSGLLKDSVVCIDGFTGLTPIQYVLLGELLKVCKDVYITVTIDNNEDIFGQSEPYELFHMSKCYIRKAVKIANDNKVAIGEIHKAGRYEGDSVLPWRFCNSPELCAIEKGLFRNKYKMTAFKDHSVHIYEGADPYEECEYIVWKIRQLVKRSGLRYRDIAVVTGDMKLYERLFAQEFEKTDIPCFIDSNKSILANALVDMITSLLAVVTGNYEQTDVIRLLRCAVVRDYLGYPAEDTDRLENYVIAAGTKGKKAWNREWTRKNYDPEALALINEYRIKVNELIMPFGDSISKCKTVLDYSKVIYEFLVCHGISGVIDSITKYYEENEMPVLQREYAQIYRIVINIIDQMAVLMGDEEISFKEYTALLETGFSEASVGVIPPGIDCIIVGDIERTRLKDIKVLFFAGVNENIIPKPVRPGGFLSDLDREYLLDKGAELAPTLRELIFNERFYLYLNVTKPSEELYLSYSKKGVTGDDLEPSSFISRITDVTGELPIDRDYKSIDTYAHLGNDGGRSWWLEGLRRAADISDEFYDNDIDPVEEATEGSIDEYKEKSKNEWLLLHREWMKSVEGKKLFESAFYRGGTGNISQKAASLLYGDEIFGSVSRLETFARCGYAHFLQYGLRLEERKEYMVSLPDIGVMFHDIVERFALHLKNNGMRWQDADEELIKNETARITAEVCEDFGNGIMRDNASNRYVGERIRRIAVSSISALVDHMKKGSFEPLGYELSFGKLAVSDSLNVKLDKDRVMHLTGRIDRLDTYETDDSVYIKIIDYKSGNKAFDLQNVYYGLDMQLVVYLSAATDVLKVDNADKIVIPAGTFYFCMDDPEIEDTGDDAKNEIKLKQEFRLRGPVNKEQPVLHLMDKTICDADGKLNSGASSDVVKVKVNNDESIYAHSPVISTKKFEYMTGYVNGLIKDFGNMMVDGYTAAKPYKLGNADGCEHCIYSAVCRFDPRLENDRYRVLAKMEENLIWEEMEKIYEAGIHQETETGD